MIPRLHGLDKENFIPQIIPYLNSFLYSLDEVREKVGSQQDKRKKYADQVRCVGNSIEVGDQVLLITHFQSNKSKGLSQKLFRRAMVSTLFQKKVSPITYMIGAL